MYKVILLGDTEYDQSHVVTQITKVIRTKACPTSLSRSRSLSLSLSFSLSLSLSRSLSLYGRRTVYMYHQHYICTMLVGARAI
jgi:hypothetical protein